MAQLAQLHDAVFIHEQQVRTDSLKVAEIFERQHKNVIQRIESLDCSPEFMSANFSAHVQTIQAGAVQRESKYYEMSKDGFIFLVMGFTGAAAARIKEAYINTFNKMAAMLYNEQDHQQHIHIGAKVQLKSGSPIYTVSRILYRDGYMQDAEIIWDNKNTLSRDIVPIACLSLDTHSILHNNVLSDFWASIHNYGITKLNHSRSPNIVALNLSQIYQAITGLPPKPQLSAILMQSKSPYPTYMQHNHPVGSGIFHKTTRCWLFDYRRLHTIEHQEHTT